MTPKEKAHEGLRLLKEATIEIVSDHSEGLRNTDVVKLLDIPSDFQGKQKNYLSWSVIGLLINAGCLKRQGNRYFIAK